MTDDNNDQPFVIDGPDRVTLRPLAIEMAKANGMTPKEMAKHLLRQHGLRESGLIQQDGKN
jgi:hypothetical protein